MSSRRAQETHPALSHALVPDRKRRRMWIDNSNAVYGESGTADQGVCDDRPVDSPTYDEPGRHDFKLIAMRVKEKRCRNTAYALLLDHGLRRCCSGKWT
jgi:hypothetical protein